MTGFFQSPGKAQHVDEALCWLLGQTFQHNLLHSTGNVRMRFAERRRVGIQVLIGNVSGQSFKGEMATEPLVNHHRQRILITGRNKPAADQFRGHIVQVPEAFFDL